MLVDMLIIVLVGVLGIYIAFEIAIWRVKRELHKMSKEQLKWKAGIKKNDR